MTTKHTPGPWEANGRAVSAGATCTGDKDWEGDTAEVKIAVAGRWLKPHCPGHYTESLREAYANARLMAAAPELLSALVGFMEWQRGVQELVPNDLYESAVKAIAKANGDRLPESKGSVTGPS